jgi:hypothetical protein
MFEGENEDREQGRGKATGHMLAIAALGIAGSEAWTEGRHLGVGVTGLPRDEDQGTGSGNEENGSKNEVPNKPVIEVAQTITVSGCSTGLSMIFVELRGTRIPTEGDFRFYIQPEVGRWMAFSECANIAFSECTSITSSECTSIAPSECMSTVT